MLMGFLKDAGDVDINCSVIKFSDRIWLSEQHNIIIQRSLALQLDTTPAQSLQSFSMVLPFRSDMIEKIEDYSHTFLKEEFWWNHRVSGAYEVLDKQKGTILWDGLIGKANRSRFDQEVVGTDFSIIRIICDEIDPGQTAFFRFLIYLKNILGKAAQDIYPFEFEYFRPSSSLTIFMGEDSLVQRDIGIIINTDGKGADISVFSTPGGHLSVSTPVRGKSYHNFMGENIYQVLEHGLWKIRNFFTETEIPQKIGFSTPSPIRILVNGSLEISHIYKKIDFWSFLIAFAALIISIIALIKVF